VGYRALKMGLSPDRDALYQRLDERCRRMFGNGLAEEAREILDRGFAAESKPFEAHGYRQVMQMLHGELDPKQALFYAQRNTRNYAKRQMTWFRKEPGMEWLKGFGDETSIQQAALDRVWKFLITS
jgi:tRNA dimethylallyltransferase